MSYNPAAKIQIRVEILTALGWIDITSRGRKASCVIRQGRSPGSIQAETSRLQLTLGNPDGYLTEDNAVSPYYGSWGNGCEIRVSRLGLTVSPAERFHGQVDSIVERFPGGEVDATVEVVAVGTLGIVEKGSDEPHSPLWRAMMGVSEGDFQPIAHWSMEDGPGSASFASSFAGHPPATITGQVSPSSYGGFVGSGPLPVLGGGSAVTAALPSYADTGVWQIQFTMMIPSSGFSNDADMIIIQMAPGKPTASIYLTYIQSSGELRLSCLNAAGTTISSVDTFSHLWQRDTPYLCAISDFVFSGTGTHLVNFAVFTADGNLVQVQTAPDGVGAGTAGVPTQFRAIASSVSSGWSVGQVSLYTADIVSTPNVGPNAQAMGGYPGELAGDRMIRLCREEGIPFELVGDAADTPAMGPQLTDTLVANLRDCETADQGLMHDNGTDGAIVHVTRRSLYNQAASIAVTKGAIEPTGVSPIRDRRYMRNDITSSRPSGGSVRITDEAHIARVKARLKDSRQVNVEADDQLSGDASWAVHLGTAKGARYDSVGINLRNADGALLADAVAAHAIGGRITVAKTALPPQHHIDGIDGLTVGWTEVLDAVDWRFAPNVMPYAPYDVSTYDTGGDRYDSDSTFLRAAAASGATSLTVGMDMDRLRWITGSGGAVFTGLYVGCEGEQLRVSSIGSLYKDTFTRTVANSWDTADTGHTYQLLGGSVPADYDIAAGVGTFAITSNNVPREAIVNGLSVADGTLYGRYLHPVVPTGANHEADIRVRRVDSNNFLDLRLFLTTGNTVLYAVRQVIAGVESAVSAFATVVRAAGGAAAATTQMAFRIDFFGTSLRSKVWAAADPEPAQWGAVTAVSHVSAGSASFIAFTGSGSTNVLPISASWDGLEMANPQTWVVDRAANGVSKAHPAGAQVRLWSPPYYGY